MDFAQLQFNNLDSIKSFLTTFTPNEASDYSVAGIFLWRDFFDNRFCIEDNTLFISQFINGRLCFYPPIGENNVNSIKKIIDYCQLYNLSGAIYPSMGCEINALKELNVQFEIIKDEGFFDYIYLISDLATFSGKKLHSHKNHLNKFDRFYKNCSLEPISDSNILKVQAFLNEHIEKRRAQQILSNAEQKESLRIPELLSHMSEFNLFGYCLIVDDAIQGFELGEIINDMYYCHVEKANREIDGAYTKMVNLIANELVGKAIYMNREEDWGHPGLRASKKGYAPCGFIEKEMIIFK